MGSVALIEPELSPEKLKTDEIKSRKKVIAPNTDQHFALDGSFIINILSILRKILDDINESIRGPEKLNFSVQYLKNQFYVLYICNRQLDDIMLFKRTAFINKNCNSIL
jgi:hypothetical protein